jgi:DNA-binding XRE family transcriptional regulator
MNEDIRETFHSAEYDEYYASLDAKTKAKYDYVAGLKTGSQHLTETYGEKGTPSREEFEAKAKAWYYAELLRDERKRQKLTQQQLGERIGKKREYISALEQGQTDMQLSTFMLIANALGLRFSLVVG